MTGLTIHSVVGRRCLRRISRVEPRPAPAIAPQLVAWVAVLAVLYHYEPALKRLGAAHSAGRHRSGCCAEDFLDQHGAVLEMPVPEIGFNRAGRCIDDMELLQALSLVSCDCPDAERLIGGAIISRDVQMALGIRDRTCRSVQLPIGRERNGRYRDGDAEAVHDLHVAVPCYLFSNT